MLARISFWLFRYPNVKLAFDRFRHPLARQMWYESVFRFHRWWTAKLWFHCLVNCHQFCTVMTQTPEQKIFTAQHWCGTCHPQIMEQYVKLSQPQGEVIPA